MCQTISKLSHPLDGNSDLLALTRRIRESTTQGCAPKILILGSKQAGPESETQSRNDLMAGLFALRPQPLSHRSNGFGNMVAARRREEKPRDSALIFPEVLTKAPIEGIPQQHFQMTNKLERSCRCPSTPFVKSKRVTLIAIGAPEIRSHPRLREHAPDGRNIDLDG
jgi:hypothetical protein